MSEEPTTFGPYTLLRKLGQGGMAVTFKAREEIPGIGGSRVVALKKILPSFANDPDFRRMFLDEARLSSQLNNQHICKTYTAGEIDGTMFISMEFIEGADLYHIMNRCTQRGMAFPLPHALYICEGVLQGLHIAHELRGEGGEPLNLVHRDVSPQNILLSRQGEVKVIDFGVAKAKSNLAKTQAGMVKGKVLYFSPEQLNGQPLDRRSDLFAVGLILYELTTGVHPLRGETDIETIFNYINREIEPPVAHNPALPQAVSELIMRALARDREDRFEDADQMARAVADALFDVYPSYQAYLLRDFAKWGIDAEGEAPYTMPQSRPVSINVNPNTPTQANPTVAAPTSNPGVQVAPPVSDPYARPTSDPAAQPWAPTPVSDPYGRPLSDPSAQPWSGAPVSQPNHPTPWGASPQSTPGWSPGGSDPRFNPQPGPGSDPRFNPSGQPPWATGQGPALVAGATEPSSSHTGWYIAIGILGLLAVGCVMAFLAAVFSAG